MRHYFIPTRIAMLKKKKWKAVSVDEDMEKLEHLRIGDRNFKWYSHLGKQYGSFSKG